MYTEKPETCTASILYEITFKVECLITFKKFSVYANYFYDTSVIFSNSFITYREPFRICIGHDRRTDVIGIDCFLTYQNFICFEPMVNFEAYPLNPCVSGSYSCTKQTFSAAWDVQQKKERWDNISSYLESSFLYHKAPWTFETNSLSYKT